MESKDKGNEGSNNCDHDDTCTVPHADRQMEVALQGTATLGESSANKKEEHGLYCLLPQLNQDSVKVYAFGPGLFHDCIYRRTSGGNLEPDEIFPLEGHG